MKKNRIDDILRDAFGELDGDLGKMTEAERTEHEQARLMRDGLRSLRDVPECQLSNERLRNAILSGAVKRRGVTTWALAGAVACTAIVLIALQMFSGSSRTTDEPGRNVASATPGAEENSVDEPLVAMTGPATNTNDALTNAVEETTAPAEPPRATTADRSVDRGSAVMMASVGRNTLDEFLMRPVSFGPDEDVALRAPAPAANAEREPIVVVDSSTTTRNGAYKATEVAAYGDVIIGG